MKKHRVSSEKATPSEYVTSNTPNTAIEGWIWVLLLQDVKRLPDNEKSANASSFDSCVKIWPTDTGTIPQNQHYNLKTTCSSSRIVLLYLQVDTRWSYREIASSSRRLSGLFAMTTWQENALRTPMAKITKTSAGPIFRVIGQPGANKNEIVGVQQGEYSTGSGLNCWIL